jgi:hypothetical protein
MGQIRRDFFYRTGIAGCKKETLFPPLGDNIPDLLAFHSQPKGNGIIHAYLK